AQVRAAFQHLSRNFDSWLAGVVAPLLTAATRVRRNAARLRRIGFMPCRPPIAGPLPHIADHVVEAVAVGRKRGYRRRPLVSILGEVLVWKVALPGIGHVPAARHELLAPGELGAVESTPRRKLPFGFGRQFLAGPFGVGLSIAVGDVNHGMIIKAADR